MCGVKWKKMFENRSTIISSTSYKKSSTCWLGDWMKLRTSQIPGILVVESISNDDWEQNEWDVHSCAWVPKWNKITAILFFCFVFQTRNEGKVQSLMKWDGDQEEQKKKNRESPLLKQNHFRTTSCTEDASSSAPSGGLLSNNDSAKAFATLQPNKLPQRLNHADCTRWPMTPGAPWARCLARVGQSRLTTSRRLRLPGQPDVRVLLPHSAQGTFSPCASSPLGALRRLWLKFPASLSRPCARETPLWYPMRIGHRQTTTTGRRWPPNVDRPWLREGQGCQGPSSWRSWTHARPPPGTLALRCTPKQTHASPTPPLERILRDDGRESRRRPH